MTDREIQEIYKGEGGQTQAFNLIVREYSKRLYWHLRELVFSHEDADDLLQEIFIKVWKSLPGFRGDSDEFTWLWRIATNETISYLRKARVRAALSFSRLDDDATRICDPDPYFDGDAAMRALRKAVLELPDKQRLATTTSRSATGRSSWH